MTSGRVADVGDSTGARDGAPRRLGRWARLGGGALIIAVLVLRVGAGPFLDGVRQVSAASLLAALSITAMTTVLSAWRWRLIARALGLRIPLGSAVASYYRSQFLNSTLPGGVVGDLHRGLRHGVEARDVSLAMRSVLWDRIAGQVAQVALATITLVALASPVRPQLTTVAEAAAMTAAVIALGVSVIPRLGLSWATRVVRTVRHDVRATLLTPRTGPVVLVLSTLVVIGHVGVFLVAAAVNDSSASIRALVPLAMLVLLAMAVPVNIGGWGPREGVAAWAFALAGLGAADGIRTATTYGVLSLAATLPGAAVLLVSRRPRPLETPSEAASPGSLARSVGAVRVPS